MGEKNSVKMDEQRNSLPYISMCVLACSLFSFVGQLVSVCIPRWWIVETEVNNKTEIAHFGIWVTTDCLDSVCTQEKSNSNGDKAWIEGVKVIEIIAVIFLLASVILSVLTMYWRRNEKRHFLLWKLFTSFSGAAGIVVVMGVLIFFKKKRGLSPSQAIATKDGHADWALVISSFSGVLSIACAVFIGCKILMKDSDDDDDIDYLQYQTKDQLTGIKQTHVWSKQKERF